MRNQTTSSHRDQFDPLIDYALTRPALSERDIDLVSAHEGYALIFVALGQASQTARINSFAGPGYCSPESHQ
ncbi:hypothetical protein [Acidithiobacillus thiooxidans]|uniref:Uncharacterized protein n=1 Tax=Acidithiobacillus thiooxidans ATCC 19377 TaxID=637390 RepID=A0A543PZX5_ACITH|nr:hypothetical protein [Acidithiobacillus thiooxidans]MDX5936362.1 hypothetical protein [Acidithiobacillus thiooxidans]TQN49634.1 hypothetical protein DLNHIDIE_03043 [Acidithiobacillus thiooxidans ATCC 19377]